MNIVIISGSARKNSLTHRVALHLQQQLQPKYSIELIDLREHHLPELEMPFVTEEKTPEQFHSLRKKMFDADAFIFVSPEYNGSYSSAMKNLIDHFPKTTYMKKAIGIVTASDGLFGGIRTAMQMQQLVCALFGVPAPQMLVTPQVDKKFDAEGNLLDETFTRNIENFLTEYLWLAEALHQHKLVSQ